MSALSDSDELVFLFGGWVHVASSNVAEIRYDPDADELDVAFADGSVYTYSACGRDRALSFARAASKGQWVDQNIVKAGWLYSSKFVPAERAPRTSKGRAPRPRRR